jgi:lipopolysaccharide biosynthesis regulator YciM
LRSTYVRASIASGEGHHEEAIELYERLFAADRRFIAELLPNLMASFKELGRLAEFDAYVEALTRKDPSLRKDLAYAAIIGDLTDSPALAACIEGFVMGNPVLVDLVNLEDLAGASPDLRERTIKRVVRGLRQLALSNARYRCTSCGYSTLRLLWHCPSCKLWETVRPIQTFQFQALVS